MNNNQSYSSFLRLPSLLFSLPQSVSKDIAVVWIKISQTPHLAMMRCVVQLVCF